MVSSKIKMKYSLLLTLFIYSFITLEICAWKPRYPTTSVKLGFSQRPQRSLFSKSSINRHLQSVLTPRKSLQRPNIRQRNIRDLMTRFMSNNPRVPMMSAQNYNRPIVQQGRPALNQNIQRGTNSQRYRQALALPSTSVLQSMEGPRAQPMIIRETALRKTNPSSIVRPLSMLRQTPVRDSSFQQQSNNFQVLRDIPGIKMQPPRHSQRQHSADSLDSAIASILSSSSNDKLRNQKAPKRVEVVHHMPMTSNPSKLRPSSSAVVYISNPKNSMQMSQSAFMRNTPQASFLSASQSQLTPNLPFIMREHGSGLSKGNRFKQDLKIQNPQFTMVKPFRQQNLDPYAIQTAGLQGKFNKDNIYDHRNPDLPTAVKRLPQSQVLRAIPSNSNVKDRFPPSANIQHTPTGNGAPRINRLKQELNAEIEQLLKLVPQSSAIATKKPKITFQQQMPHPFMIPSPQHVSSTSSKQIKSVLNPEILKHIPGGRQVISISNPKLQVQKPHFPSQGTANEQFLKVQAIERLPPMSDTLSINQRRPVVSEASVDSEELTEILKSIGYNGDKKEIHNAASIKPVKLIIPGNTEEKNKESVQPFSQSESLVSSNNKATSFHKDLSQPSYNANSQYTYSKQIPSSHAENVAYPYDKHLPPSHNNSPSSHNDNTPISHNEHFGSEREQIDQAHNAEFSSVNKDGSPVSEDLTHQNENLPLLSEDLPSLSEDLSPSKENLPPPVEDLHGEHSLSSYYEELPIPKDEYLDPSLPENLPPLKAEFLPSQIDYLSHPESKDVLPFKAEEWTPSTKEGLISFSNIAQPALRKTTRLPFKSHDFPINNHTTTPPEVKENLQINSRPVYTKFSEADTLSSETLPVNKSSPSKTYLDLREISSGLETTPPQFFETTSHTESITEKEPEVNDGINSYQGEESVASLSVKEEFPMEEELKKKYNKQENFNTNTGSLHDLYNMKIHDERKEGVPILHVVRNFPQHFVPAEAEIISTPGQENIFVPPISATEINAPKVHKISDLQITNKPIKKVQSFIKPPKERIRNIFPHLNIRERPVAIKISEDPKYIVPNRNINLTPIQRPTPGYSMPKMPERASFGQRNRPKNENSLIRKYIPRERYQLNEGAFSGSANYPANPPVYVTPETYLQNPSSPRQVNFRLRPFTTKPTAQRQSSLNFNKSNIFKLETSKESGSRDHKSESITTTETPEIVTPNAFELNTAESQVEDTQEAENAEKEYEHQQTPETITIPHKQFFRGPQHSVVLEDFTETKNIQEMTTDFTPQYSLETTSSSTPVTYIPKNNDFMPYNETGGVRQYSVHSQSKVINALHLANKVFGRKNQTSFKQSLTTTNAPHIKHKFTYAPVNSSTKSSTEESESTTGKKLVFNFRTGTTQSLPQRTSSAAPKVIHTSTNRNKATPRPIKNESLDFIPVLKDDDKVIISPKNSSKTSLFQHVVFSQPNISSRFHNESASTESTKDLYGILKPITKPYNASITIADESDKKFTTKIYRIRITSTTMKSVGPSSEAATENPDKYSSTLDSPEYEPELTTASETENDYSKGVISAEILETTESLPLTTMTEIPSQTTNRNVGRNTTRDLETITTTELSEKETVTEPLDQEQLIVDSMKSMKLKMQDMASKGLRHLMPLVMELSSDVSISSDCTFSLLRWLRAVRTMEQWAVRMMDASSKMPEGILYGTFSTFGSYDECIGIKTPKANLQMPYSGQYCSINIQPILPPKDRHFTIQNAFKKYSKLKQVYKEMNIEEDTMAYYYILKHRIGVCMPSTCSVEDLGNVTEKLAEQLKMKITVERCETSEKPKLTKSQVVSLTGVFVAFGIVLLATIIDISIRVKSDHEMDIDEIIRKKNGLRQFSFVFSAYGNACKILNTSIPTTHLSSLHGIKFLSISWVMLGHVYYCKDYLTLAGLNKVRDLGSNLAFQVVLNSAFAADTFFYLSGLLVVYSTFLYMENNNGRFTIVGFYIRRYWRLTPAFLMISGVILLGPLAGSGPIWHETLQPFVAGCENYWWTNLFYFSNFVPTAKTCVPHGWFLSCDMQFYIVAPIIILALYRRPKLGILLIIMGILSSMITTGFLTFLYDLPPVSLFSLPDPKDINEYLDTVGYKPYAHYASYCVGMATGFLLAAKQKISLSKCLQIFGWVVSTVICCLVIYGTWNWNSGELPSWPVSVAYATTSRLVWCLGVAWITVVCYAGHGGPINSILSWHGFIPLSRLSYLAYLIHPLLMYLYASYIRSPFYFSQYVVVYLYLGHLCVTFGLAFLFSLAFEVPFLNLEKVITMYLDNSKRKRRASFSNHHNNWTHPEHPELKDSVVLMRRRADKFLS